MYDILPTKRSVNLPTTNQRGFQRCWWCFSISRYFCLLCDAAEVFVVRQSIYRHLQICLSFSLQNGSTFSCYIVTGHLPLLFDLGFQRWFNLKLSPSHKWLDKELAQEFNKKNNFKNKPTYVAIQQDKIQLQLPALLEGTKRQRLTQESGNDSPCKTFNGRDAAQISKWEKIPIKMNLKAVRSAGGAMTKKSLRGLKPWQFRNLFTYSVEERLVYRGTPYRGEEDICDSGLPAAIYHSYSVGQQSNYDQTDSWSLKYSGGKQHFGTG